MVFVPCAIGAVFAQIINISKGFPGYLVHSEGISYNLASHGIYLVRVVCRWSRPSLQFLPLVPAGPPVPVGTKSPVVLIYSQFVDTYFIGIISVVAFAFPLKSWDTYNVRMAVSETVNYVQRHLSVCL